MEHSVVFFKKFNMKKIMFLFAITIATTLVFGQNISNKEKRDSFYKSLLRSSSEIEPPLKRGIPHVLDSNAIKVLKKEIDEKQKEIDSLFEKIEKESVVSQKQFYDLFNLIKETTYLKEKFYLITDKARIFL